MTLYSVFLADYDPNPTKDVLTLMRSQERDCTNITIIDDVLVEEDVEFNVSISLQSQDFGAGVNITLDIATVVIEDDDGNDVAT